MRDLYDFHSHILPGVDDGSRNAYETLAMLNMMAEQGVKKVLATPHFYATYDTFDRFFKKREEGAKELKEVHDKNRHPEVCLGAEVLFFPGISRTDNIVNMKISGSDYILIEMPFAKWGERVIEELLDLKRDFHLKPILAHIEHFLPFKNLPWLEMLKKQGILFQSNADFFLNKKTEKTAMKMLADGFIDVLGSDSHNTVSRPPLLGEATAKIQRVLGDVVAQRVYNKSKALFDEITSL